MTYVSPESAIKRIMAESHAPALKIPEPDRVKAALEVLKNSGVTSAAKKDDNTIVVSNGEVEKAFNIMDRALQHGMIQAKPQVVSAEAMDPPEVAPDPTKPSPEPHPPEGGHKIGESFDGRPDSDEDLPVNKAKEDSSPNLELQKRSLVNRIENQIKKIDESLEKNDEIDALIREATEEDLEQLDEVSSKYIKNYMIKNYINQDNLEAKHKETGKMTRKDLKKAINREKGEDLAVKKITGHARVVAREEVEIISELSKGTLKRYIRKAVVDAADSSADIVHADHADDGDAATANELRVKNRIRGVTTAANKLAKEEVVSMVQRIVTENLLVEGKRLVATHHSDDGKHSAKVYKDTDYGEHHVKYYINGKHHEPADSFHGDASDAHGTAMMELGRLTKLSGTFKEALEIDEEAAIEWLNEEIEQLDELSKELLGRYIAKSGKKINKMTKDKPSYMLSDKKLDKHERRQNGFGLALGKITGSERSRYDGHQVEKPDGTDREGAPKVLGTGKITDKTLKKANKHFHPNYHLSSDGKQK